MDSFKVLDRQWKDKISHWKLGTYAPPGRLVGCCRDLYCVSNGNNKALSAVVTRPNTSPNEAREKARNWTKLLDGLNQGGSTISIQRCSDGRSSLTFSLKVFYRHLFDFTN